MRRYFFDLVSDERSEYDYRGCDFSELSNAEEMATLMALDLGIEPESRWSGWTVNVRNAHGQEFFRVPVPQVCLAA
jgi:uncharacterized protein DUF6894